MLKGEPVLRTAGLHQVQVTEIDASRANRLASRNGIRILLTEASTSDYLDLRHALTSNDLKVLVEPSPFDDPANVDCVCALFECGRRALVSDFTFDHSVSDGSSHPAHRLDCMTVSRLASHRPKHCMACDLAVLADLVSNLPETVDSRSRRVRARLVRHVRRVSLIRKAAVGRTSAATTAIGRAVTGSHKRILLRKRLDGISICLTRFNSNSLSVNQ